MRLETMMLVALLALGVGCDDGGPGGDPLDAGAGGTAGEGGAGGQAGAGGEAGTGGEAGAGGEAGTGGEGGMVGNGDPVFESQKNNLRFKRADRIRLEFARVLDLLPDELCAEMGQFDCIDEIHRVTLGGVEPYRANIYEEFEATSLSAPLIVERVALAACSERVNRDGADLANAVIFRDVPVNAEIRIADIEDPSIDAAIERLFTRAFLRPPTAEDIADLEQLYRDIEGSGVSEAPARDWAVLACMITLTSVESLFY